MQKFTRPITREVELNGQRLALTFSEQGLSMRPVGSRKPPREVSWNQLLAHVLDMAAAPQAADMEPPPPPNPLGEPVAAGADGGSSSLGP